MKLVFRTVCLFLLLSWTFSQDAGFDLSDAFDDLDPVPTPAKPKADKPKEGGGDFGFDLEDALKPDSGKKPADNPPKSGGSDTELDLFDALGPDDHPKPDKPAVKPPNSGGGGGGGTLSDDDLLVLTGGGGGGNYEPDGGRPAGGGGNTNYDSYDHHGGADEPQGPDLLWGQILKLLSANIPEEFFMWISNVKQTVTPLLQRIMDLLEALPGNAGNA